MLEIQNAIKVFGRGTPVEHTALKGLNLSVPDGDFVTIIGSNGAGKSTLFNAICGTFLLDEGTIVLNGKDITFLKEHKRAKVIGRVFQDPMVGTAPGMTIAENLALAHSRTTASALHFSPTRAQKNLFRERLSEYGMGLEDRMETKVGLLSGGQRQAVTLLMCTIVMPQLLLLDEHTAALDPATAEKVLELTRKVVRENHLTCMMITHNMHSALELSNRTLVMDSGNVVLDIQGEERKKMTVPALLEAFRMVSGHALDNDRMMLS